MEKQKIVLDYRHQAFRFNQRLLHTILALAMIVVILIGRLFWLQIVEHKRYTTLSNQNLLAVIPLPPSRGIIYDRYGTIIANNIPSYTLTLTPSKIKNLKQAIKSIQAIIPLSSTEIQDFYLSIRQHHRFEADPLKENLSETQVAKYYINRYRLPGVNVSVKQLRQYPQGKYLSSILGYIGRINQQELHKIKNNNYQGTDYIGKVGIEKHYENKLHGTVGNAIAEINANGKIMRYISRTLSIPGDNLTLTVDSKLQAFCYNALKKVTGSIVMIDPQNGDVLAMVSTPSYDPNPFVSGISHQEYKKLLSSPRHPLYNRSIRGLFSPGSTIKPFYVIAALSSHLITPQTKIFDPGWFRLPHTKHVYHDWKRNGHGWVNVRKAIIVSCDTFFYHLAVEMGISSMDQVLNKFGFGQLTGIDIGEELAGIVPSPQWKRAHQHHPWYTGDTIITGIGQGSLLITPLQLATATTILANRGKHIIPHLLKSESNNLHQKFAYTSQSLPAIYTHDTSNWRTVISAMQQVIMGRHGTAINFGKHASYSTAAKTGTAQVYGKSRDEEYSRTNIPLKLRNNHLFIAFAPINHPRVAIAVVIEHSNDADGIARKVMDFYFHHDQVTTKR